MDKQIFLIYPCKNYFKNVSIVFFKKFYNLIKSFGRRSEAVGVTTYHVGECCTLTLLQNRTSLTQLCSTDPNCALFNSDNIFYLYTNKM